MLTCLATYPRKKHTRTATGSVVEYHVICIQYMYSKTVQDYFNVIVSLHLNVIKLILASGQVEASEYTIPFSVRRLDGDPARYKMHTRASRRYPTPVTQNANP